MKKLADVLALLTFLIGVGFFLYGQSTYTSLKAELDQDEAECGQLPEMGIEKFNCAMGTINSSGRVHDAEEMRNFGFAFAIGGPSQFGCSFYSGGSRLLKFRKERCKERRWAALLLMS